MNVIARQTKGMYIFIQMVSKDTFIREKVLI